MTRRWIIVVAALMVLAATAAGAVVKIQRDRRAHEWAHGGDEVNVSVEVRLAGAEDFHSTLVALGAAPDHDANILPGEQAVVVRVMWTGATQTTGVFNLIGLDKRVRPGRMMRAGGMEPGNPSKVATSSWASSYEALEQHYEWLTGTSRVYPLGMAAWVPASKTGSLTAYLTLLPEQHPRPLIDPASEILLALFYTNDVDVRWARRIYG